MENTKPEKFMSETKVSDTPNKSRKTGEIISHTYSTVIPKPIINKLGGIEKGQLLYWDINENNQIVITPETQEDSIKAGNEILNDFIVNNNNHYGTHSYTILGHLQSNKPKEDIIETIVSNYKMETRDEYKTEMKKVIIFLLGYPLDIPDKNEILRAVYNEISKTD